MKDIILYVLAAIVLAVLFISILILFRMISYKECVNKTGNIYYCEAKWK